MKRLFVAAVAVGLVGVVPAVDTQAASTPKISFTLKAAPANSSLLFIGTRTARKVPVGAKTISLPGTFKVGNAYRFSVHFISSTGRYLGPVVFGTKAPAGKWTTFVVTKASLRLGTISYQAEGWAKSSLKLGTGQFGKLLRGAKKNGQPRGAGRLGVLAKLAASGVVAFAKSPCPAEADQELGTDCDGDGIVNVIDVDDDGDAVLDVADKSTEDFSASGWIPTAGTRSEVGNTGGTKVINSNLNPATMESDIDQMFGSASSGFGISFFLNLTTEDAIKLDAAWVDCGAIEYCGREAGAASTGPTSSLNNKPFNDLFCQGFVNSGGGCSKTILWKDFPGYIYDKTGYAKVVDKGEGIYNGMQLSSIDGNGYTWVGFMRPTLGANALSKIKTGDPYIVKVRDKATGAVREIPMALGAFFLTTPAVKSLGDTPIDYSKSSPLGSYSNPYVVGEDGIVKVTFYRPQRAAIDGTDPAGQKY
ncbi:MAG: thrombospondin type 3 repeat-containing protein, partial [Solirubrobacterales bacterium]